MVDSWLVERRNRAFVVGGTKVLAGAAKQVSAGKQPLGQDQVAAQPGDQVPEQPAGQGRPLETSAMAASPRPQSSPENRRRVQFRFIHMFKDM